MRSASTPPPMLPIAFKRGTFLRNVPVHKNKRKRLVTFSDFKNCCRGYCARCEHRDPNSGLLQVGFDIETAQHNISTNAAGKLKFANVHGAQARPKASSDVAQCVGGSAR